MASFFFHELSLELNKQGGSKLRKGRAKKEKYHADAAKGFDLQLETNLSRSVSSLGTALTADTTQTSSSSSSPRQSIMRRISLPTIEYFRTQAGTPDTEIDSFLAGGRANPNPYLHEAQEIAAMDLGLMTIAQIREALKSPITP